MKKLLAAVTVLAVSTAHAVRIPVVLAIVAGVEVGIGTGTIALADPVTQLNYIETGFDQGGVPLVVPCIDPAGITYHPPSGHLFIADSEINEVAAAFALIGANIFEISLNGDTLYDSYDLTALGNTEPTGIAFSPVDGHFYVTNDDDTTVTRYSYSPGFGFAFDDDVDTVSSAGMDDPEGITVDPLTGLIYVADGGAESIIVYSYDGSGFDVLDILDLQALNAGPDSRADPEGIAFDFATGHLFVVSQPDVAIFEYTTAGIFVAKYDLTTLTPATIAPQGLTFAPASGAGASRPGASLYIADGRIDNGQDPDERDGAVYEVLTGAARCGNGVVDPGED